MNQKTEAAQLRSDGYFFTRRMFKRQYIPAVISAATLAASDVADAVVVGNRMGMVGLAAMAFVLPVFMIYNVIMHSFGLGGSIRFSDQMARGEERKAVSGFQGVVSCLVMLGIGIAALGNVLLVPIERLLGADPANTVLFSTTGVYLRLILGAAPLFFIAYSLGYYMRNADMEKEASICASTGNIIDIALNVVLVIGLRKGAIGAGIATLIGVLVTSALELTMLHIRKSPLRLFPRKVDYTGLWHTFRTGFSSSISYIYSLVYLLICNNLLMRMSGERGVAIFDVVQNISYFFIYLYGAAAQAVQPILSTYHGEHNDEGCRTLERMSMRVALAVGAVAAVTIALIAPAICRFFGIRDESAVTLGAWAIRMFCISTMLGGLNMLLGSFPLARGAEWPAFVCTSLRGAIVLLPVTILFSSFGEHWFWVLYPVTELLALAAFLLYRRYRYREKDSLAPERVYRAMLHDRVEDIGPVTQEIDAFCERWKANMKQQYFVQMTVEELCSAIIVNGFSEGRDRSGMIQITLVAGEDGVFTLHVRDSAVAFNPFGMESADLKGNSEDMDFNAVGMDVIKTKADEFFYRRYQGFNTMVVKI